MARGLSQQQQTILSEATRLGGASYHGEFLPKVKAVLWPDHYTYTEYYPNSGYNLHNTRGWRGQQKAAARASLSRSVRRLLDRGLLKIENGNIFACNGNG